MRKIFICLFTILLFLININYVYAIEIDMNLSNSFDENAVITDDTDTIPAINNDIINTNNPVDNASVSQADALTAKTSTTSTSEDFKLTVSDIINIILIAVGIVLIFLAIAILIKLK